MVKLIADRMQHELRELARPGPRMADEIACVISVMLAVVFAQLAHARMVDWAAVSALVLLKSDTMETIVRGVMRMVGTLIGGALALVLAPLAVQSLTVAIVSAGVVGTIGLYGMLTGRRAYAWFLMGLTFEIILLDKLANPHLDTIEFAHTRLIEVGAGTLACVLVSLAAAFLSGNDWLANRKPRPERMRWNPTAARHAAQAGIALATLPALYSLTHIPELTQAAITIIAVMIVPVAGLGQSGLVPVSRRLAHRAIGCLAAALLSIGVLVLANGNVVIIVAGTCLGLFIGRHLETGGKATQYVGLQFSIALLTALVPDSYSHIETGAAMTRLAGIAVGMATLEPVLLSWHFIGARVTRRFFGERGGAQTPARDREEALAA
ncbi:FUSC family protein [Novosphingobium sp. 1949]|uniref:FUSC family protein n=1 Tax=Novosphingobium organovorum TaxID=2930092 RepID=A0ABT0BBA0_9SPHN|nr:FUSC family protein [Novosphingobium organovorum]MCJ2182335.1 FUSC family protein [Novosphingobium organovorum]